MPKVPWNAITPGIMFKKYTVLIKAALKWKINQKLFFPSSKGIQWSALNMYTFTLLVRTHRHQRFHVFLGFLEFTVIDDHMIGVPYPLISLLEGREDINSEPFPVIQKLVSVVTQTHT